MGGSSSHTNIEYRQLVLIIYIRTTYKFNVMLFKYQYSGPYRAGGRNKNRDLNSRVNQNHSSKDGTSWSKVLVFFSTCIFFG